MQKDTRSLCLKVPISLNKSMNTKRHPKCNLQAFGYSYFPMVCTLLFLALKKYLLSNHLQSLLTSFQVSSTAVCLIGMKLQQICKEVNLCSDSQKKITPCGLHSCTSYIKVCITGSPSASKKSLGAYNILFPIESSLSLP
jgi:hypothetical protein